VAGNGQSVGLIFKTVADPNSFLREIFRNWFDVDVCKGMKDNECCFVGIRFFRRHVFEHNGGEVDQRYLDESGDTSVRLKQHIRETQEDGHALLGSLVKMARNIHSGFHELIPPIPGPIKTFEEQKAWREKHGG
jgi:hypothetical protein